MKEPTLKPCPFCGGKARLISGQNKAKQALSPILWQVLCTKGCVVMPLEISDHDAVNNWNRRAKDGEQE